MLVYTAVTENCAFRLLLVIFNFFQICMCDITEKVNFPDVITLSMTIWLDTSSIKSELQRKQNWSCVHSSDVSKDYYSTLTIHKAVKLVHCI